MTKKSRINIKIIGLGITGALTALSLSKYNVKVSISDRKSIEELLDRDRVYAINHSSRRIFKKLNIWDDLSSQFMAFNSLLIQDYLIEENLLLTKKDHLSQNISSDAIGWTIEHSILLNHVIDKLLLKDNVDVELNSISTDNNYYDLYIGADGILSNTRRKLSSRNFNYKYNQSCITFKALLRVPYEDRAYEILRPEGPMALLPMGGNLFQVVLSYPKIKCKEIEDLSYSEFLDRISTLLPYGLEIDALVNHPQTFPVMLSMSSKLFSRNTFIIGESAHSFHPVGGQGLNLCLRDINDLTVIINDLNSSKINPYTLLKYNAYRFTDTLIIAFMTHSLIITFSNKIYIMRIIRYLLFFILKSSPLVRRLILAIMTNGIYMKG